MKASDALREKLMTMVNGAAPANAPMTEQSPDLTANNALKIAQTKQGYPGEDEVDTLAIITYLQGVVIASLKYDLQILARVVAALMERNNI